MIERMSSALAEAQIREVIQRALSSVAPEVDLDTIDPAKDLREQADIDSVGFLTFVIGLHRELNIEIPDADASKLVTLNGCADYLSNRLQRA